MADETKQPEGQPAAGSPPAEAQNTVTPPKPEPVPYERFKEVNDSLAELKKWKSDQDKAAKEAAQKTEAAEAEKLKQQGEWQKATAQAEVRAKEATSQLEAKTAEVEQLTERAKKYEKALTGYVKTLTEGLPEAIVDLLKGQDVVDQLEWLAKNRASLTAGKGGGVPPTPAPAGAGVLNDDEKRKRAVNVTTMF